jgi:hypothetical protein
VNFPGRPCFSCGAPPSAAFADGSPLYRCSHPATSTSSLFAPINVPLRVALTRADLAEAERGAKLWHRTGEQYGLADRQRQGHEWKSDLVGARGQLAFALWMGVPIHWRKFSDKHEGDVAGCEVKTATRRYGLVVHENDPADRPVVLVIEIDLSLHEIAGWIRAGDGRRDEWRGDPGKRRPAWFVPQQNLRDPAELRRTYGLDRA